MIVPLLLAALAQDMVDNVEFKAWASFKPGSTVTHKYQVEGKDQTSEQKTTLKSVDEKEVVLEVEMSVNGKVMGKPAERKVAAQIATDKAPRKLKDGEEEIEAAGQKLKCRWVEVEVKVASGKTYVLKIWANDDVPGRAVRIETTAESKRVGTQVAIVWEKK